MLGQSFKDLPPETQWVYRRLKEALKSKNTKPFNLWVTGSRATGRARTEEESIRKAMVNNVKPKFSDYDFCTDAVVIPNLQDLERFVGVKLDRAGGGCTRILVEDA